MMVYMLFGASIYFYFSSRLFSIVKVTSSMPSKRVITGDYPYIWGSKEESIFVKADLRVCPIICKQLTLSRQNG